MKLRYCSNLTTTPDFSEITNLEELSLEGCVNLVSLHPSIGMLKRLLVLNLSDCKRLQNFPGKIQPRWWTSITVPFGLLSKQQHPQISVSLTELYVDGCKELKVLPELPSSVWNIHANHCTSLREVSGSSKGPFRYRLNAFRNCPKLFKNVTIDSQGSILKTQCLDSSITSHDSIHQQSAFLRYLGFHNICEFFLQDNVYSVLDIVYHGNSIPEWFTNRSTENHVKVELPSDWCFNKFRGYGTCVVFKCKKPLRTFKGYSVKNFDGASLTTKDYFPIYFQNYFIDLVIGIQDSYMIWLHYMRDTPKWNKAKNFAAFCFLENNEDVEVKESGVRLICDEDIEQEADLLI